MVSVDILPVCVKYTPKFELNTWTAVSSAIEEAVKMQTRIEVGRLQIVLSPELQLPKSRMTKTAINAVLQ